MAVPDVQPRDVEPGPDPGDLTRIGDDRVLVARLPRLRRLRRRPGRDLHLAGPVVHDDVLATHHLEGQLVDVHRVRVRRGVVQLPHLGGAHRGVLGDRVRPQALGEDPRGEVGVAGHGAEQRLGGPVEEGRLLLEQGQRAGDGRLRQRVDGGEAEVLRRGGVVRVDGRHHPELQDLTGRVAVRDVEVRAGHAAAEGLVGPHVGEDVVARRDRGGSRRSGPPVRPGPSAGGSRWWR